MNNTQNEKDFIAAVRTKLVEAGKMFGLEAEMDLVEIRMDIRKRSLLGQASRTERSWMIDFNRSLVLATCKHLRDLTIPHEIAHVVGFMKPELEINGHNSNWVDACIKLGGDGKEKADAKENKQLKRAKGSAAAQLRGEMAASGMDAAELLRNRDMFLAYAMNVAGMRTKSAARSCFKAQLDRMAPYVSVEA